MLQLRWTRRESKSKAGQVTTVAMIYFLILAKANIWEFFLS